MDILRLSVPICITLSGIGGSSVNSHPIANSRLE